MRISTITNWAYGITLVLTGLAGAAFLSAAQSSQAERQAVEQHLAFDVLAEDLVVSAERLTDEARLFAVRGQARHLDAFHYEKDEVQSRNRAIQKVRAMGAAPAELAAVAEAERDIAELDRLELDGVNLAESGDLNGAQAVLFGPEHERAQAAVLGALNRFRTLVSTRTELVMHRSQRDADAAMLVAKVMLGLTALLFLAVLYFVLRRRVAVPLVRMTGIVKRLAKQDYAVEVPKDFRHDEIGDMTQAIEVFRQNGLERERLEAERRADQRAKDSILQMMHRLQACETLQELAEVVACFAPQTFPSLAGRLYVYDDDRHSLSLAASWLDPEHSDDAFPPTACWGLRRGRPHLSHGEHQDVSCPHIDSTDAKTLCVPLTAQGDTIGLLYFEDRPDAALLRDTGRDYLELMSDNIALALANLRLRERLADLAIRDGLTGLLNRRRLDETLAGYRAQPAGKLAGIMVDIDHFKRFNDEFGHDAGDAVMQHVAQIMRQVVSGKGDAHRFGGEEFTVLLPATTEAEAVALAEQLRTQIGATPLAHHGRMLGHITVSLGVAVCPDDGPAATLLQRADAALLEAKASGRNQTVAASKSRPALPLRKITKS